MRTEIRDGKMWTIVDLGDGTSTESTFIDEDVRADDGSVRVARREVIYWRDRFGGLHYVRRRDA